MANPGSVEQIMKRVRDYVKYGNIDASKIFDLEEFNKSCAQNNENWNVDPGFLPQSKSRLIGPVINICKKIIGKIIRLAFRPYYRKQNLFNASVTKSINELFKVLHTIDGTLIDMRDSIDLQREQNEWLNDKIENSAITVDMAEERIQQYNKKISFLANRLLKENNDLLGRIRRNERKIEGLNKVENAISNVPKDLAKDDLCGFDYYAFEQRFRSDEKLVKNYQRAYLKYFSKEDLVLDIGCGRGEFLELLKESDIKAMGIELNEDFVGYCTDKGLDVKKDDAVSFLKKLTDSSLNGILMSHVVEHLEFNELICILRLCVDKLKDGGHIIIETPNPTTLAIFTNAFYIDPTHKRPVHPETLRFLLEETGFIDIELKNFDFSKVDYDIPLLNAEQVYNLREFNDGINVLNNLLFGFQDYALIAKKEKR
jgi:2-polyprenyl-3-methyl-5-hydroxy-6-metoxy-1,4-benzoquinol methylase